MADNLQATWKELEEAWAECLVHWHDEKGTHFTRNYWSVFEQEFPRLVESINEMQDIIRESKKVN